MDADELGQADAFLYGRRTYGIMAAFWPTADEDPQGSLAEPPWNTAARPT